MVCSESKVSMIEEKVPVPPPLPTSPLPSKRNVQPPPPPPPEAERQPRKNLCHKRAVRVLVTSGVLLLLIPVIAVVIKAVILGRTGGTNNTFDTNINIS